MPNSFIKKSKTVIRGLIGEETAVRLGTSVRKLKPHKRLHSLPEDQTRLAALASSGAKLKLHFGCGPHILEGWVNLDIFYNPHWQEYYSGERFPAELRGGKEDFFLIDIAEGPLPLPDNSVATIFHEDFIEHITQRETVLFLAETLRVLKPGGIHRVNTPDLADSMKRHSDFKRGWNGVYIREWNKHGHINILTRAYLAELAKMVGYTRVEFNARNKSVSTDLPNETRPGNDRNDSEQIFCDLIK